MGVDARDWFKPGGGVSRLTTRRLLLFVDTLSRTGSLFWSELADIDPLSVEGWIMSDVFAALAGEVHPARTVREDRRKAVELERRKQQVRALERARAKANRAM